MPSRKPPDENKKRSKRLWVQAEITLEDAERIKQAFAEGKLKDLGFKNIIIGPEVSAESKGWSDKEGRSKARTDKGIDPS